MTKRRVSLHPLRLSPSVKSRIGKIARQFQSVVVPDSLNRIARDMHELGRRINAFSVGTANMLIEYGWPPPLELPVSQLNEFRLAYEEGRLQSEDLAQAIISFHDAETLGGLLERWRKNDFIAHRTHLLSEAIEAYEQGRYASCVPLILLNTEGIIGDFQQKKKPSVKDALVRLFSDYGLTKSARDFYTNQVLASYDWRKPASTGLLRNAILHGKDTEFGTQENALKAILLFDIVQRAIDTKRNKSKTE